LSARQRIVLANDTSDLATARHQAKLAHQAGASVIKQGLELASAAGSGWEMCAEIAAEEGLDWIADAKVHDIPNTTVGIVGNLVRLKHPPLGITIHAASGQQALEAAQAIAGPAGVILFGVTELTSKSELEIRSDLAVMLQELGIKMPPSDFLCRKLFVRMLAHKARQAGLAGLVASPQELAEPIRSDPTTADSLTLIPGTRSDDAARHDQQNSITPLQAIVDGADLLVVGRQVTGSSDPMLAFQELVQEIEQGLEQRKGDT
jgi:orotidine-5'-phosphate decarboxylase